MNRTHAESQIDLSHRSIHMRAKNTNGVYSNLIKHTFNTSEVTLVHNKEHV